jgi:hypothetical protein
MAQLLLKNTPDPGRVPTHLAQGEVAINTTDGKIFYSDGAAGNIKEFKGNPFPYTGSAIITGSLQVVGVLTQTGSFNISGSLNVSQGITGSLFGTSSYALTASYAMNGGGGGGTPGGSTTQIQYNNAGAFAGSSNLTWNGTVLRVTGSLNITGSITSSADARINGLTIGRGGGNISTNTAIGIGALISNTSGNKNTVVGYGALSELTAGIGNISIGYQAGKSNGSDYSTTIGSSMSPGLTNFGQSYTLNIAKDDQLVQSVTGKTGFPHFWSPAQKNFDPGDIKTIIDADTTAYSAAFIDYNLEDSIGAMRAGTIKCIWDTSSKYKLTEETTDSLGTTIDYVFTVVNTGGVFSIYLNNNSVSRGVAINFTSRLLLRPRF